MIFIDLKLSHDIIKRHWLWSALIHFGIPKKCVNQYGTTTQNTLYKLGLQGEKCI